MSRLIGLYVVCYAVWLAICAAGMWLLFQAVQLVISLSIYFQFNPWQVRAVDKWGTFVLGLAYFAAAFVLEGYLRGSVAKGLLWPRATRSLIMLAILTILIVGLNWLL
ncbi:MAG: hypothetical protein R2911_18080 [Caldilineaceae bacterium]